MDSTKEFRNEYGALMVRDFRDLCREELGRHGMAGLARLWLRTFLDLAVTALAERSSGSPDDKEVIVNKRKLAGAGFVLLVAPLYFVTASLFKYGLGIGFLFDPLEAFLSDPEKLHIFDLISPVVFLGVLVLALVLNVYAVLRINVGWEDGALVRNVRLNIKLLNVAVVVVSSFLLVILVGYVLFENFTRR